LDEGQVDTLLERVQTEVFSIKQKLDNDLKQEKKKLHQKLVMKRRRELLLKVEEALSYLLLPKPSQTCPEQPALLPAHWHQEDSWAGAML
jgi:ellis van creveld syndrome protein 2